MSELDSPPKSFGPALSFAEKGDGGATRGSNSRGTKGGRWVGGRRWKSENETATSGRKDRRKWCDKGKKLMEGGGATQEDARTRCCRACGRVE